MRLTGMSSLFNVERVSAATAAATLIACVTQGVLASEGNIVARGTTNTIVERVDSGRFDIVPASVINDVSYNAFSTFDVGIAGARFLNEGVQARTIVAEVFSTSPSHIAGPLSIDGPRANLILANQNGIRINGGGFINFGSVALGTGKVGLRDVELAPGLVQRYVDLSTREGEIVIGQEGLNADLIRLELIARRVGIEGPVTNAYSSSSALVRVVAGGSETSFDTAASPTDNLTPWAYHSAAEDGVAATALAVDVSTSAGITSGRIEIWVTDAGAGVRNAGDLLASSGDFLLTSSGRVEQRGGSVRAAGKVRVVTGTFDQVNEEDRQSTVSASGSLLIDAQTGIRNVGGILSGGMRDMGEEATPHAVTLVTEGTLEHRSEPGGAGAIVFGGADDIGVFARQGIVTVGARILSNGALRMETEGNAINETLHEAGPGRIDWSRSESVLFGLLERHKSGYSVDMGKLTDPSQLAYWVADKDMEIKAADIKNLGGHIFSNDGDLFIDIDHEMETRAHSVGSFSYRQSCLLFICDKRARSSETLVGGQISAGGNIHIRAGERIVNEGGGVLALGDVILESPEIIARAKPVHTALWRDQGLKSLFGHNWARIQAADQGGGFTAQFGRLVLHGEAIQERGYFAAAQGVEGLIRVIEPPSADPVVIEDHLGFFFW